MKTYSAHQLLAAALGLAALTTASCTDKSTTESTTGSTTTTVAPATVSRTPSVGATDVSTATAITTWNDLKALPYAARTEFAAGVARLENEVTGQVAALNAKRTTMTGATDTKAWDFAMKDMVDAQTYLKSTAAELSKSTPETWNQSKDKVGEAWTRTQEAYGKVKASTTG